MPDKPRQGVTAGEAGHHSAGGRNVIPVDGGHEGSDIFHAAVQMSRMPMCLTDPHRHDNPIIFCNQAFEQLTGYPREEIIGRNCRFLQGEGTDAAAVAEIHRALDAAEDVHIELLNYRKDGSSFWNALFISPVTDTRGKLVYHFASQLDVTRRREAEAVLQQSQRMETLGSMASSLAHEFNNLMTIVLGNLERLRDEVETPRGRKSIENAAWGANRAARLTDQMLSFARRQFHDNRVLDLNATLSNCDAILDQMAGSGVKVRLVLAAETLMASLDASQLEMALLNLVRNAADAGGNGTGITITSRSRRDDTDERDAIEITVEDDGGGMPPEVVARATEPFFTTKALGRGTGLGLSMVKGFVEQSGGRLEIGSEVGRGTTIRMVFPRVAGG
ncbi:MAG: PAS domain-containing protein [Gluconacetobacter diazotrophicus]|nr:PAS domain-containing protein [Gluconacetobacter diazotrophicus]